MLEKIYIEVDGGEDYKEISANVILPNLLSLLSFSLILILGILLQINIWFVCFFAFISTLLNFSVGMITLATIRDKDTTFDTVKSTILKIKLRSIKKITLLNTSSINALKLSKDLEDTILDISKYLDVEEKLHTSKEQLKLEMEDGTFDMNNLSSLSNYEIAEDKE